MHSLSLWLVATLSLPRPLTSPYTSTLDTSSSRPPLPSPPTPVLQQQLLEEVVGAFAKGGDRLKWAWSQKHGQLGASWCWGGTLCGWHGSQCSLSPHEGLGTCDLTSSTVVASGNAYWTAIPCHQVGTARRGARINPHTTIVVPEYVSARPWGWNASKWFGGQNLGPV